MSASARAENSSGDQGTRLLVSGSDAEDRDCLSLVSLWVYDMGARSAAHPTRTLGFAEKYRGAHLPVAVFDPDRLAFLEPVGGLSHRFRLAPGPKRVALW